MMNPDDGESQWRIATRESLRRSTFQNDTKNDNDITLSYHVSLRNGSRSDSLATTRKTKNSTAEGEDYAPSVPETDV